jgi:uncharacterized protein
MVDLRHLSADHARRFLVRRHLLDPPRSLPAEPASVLRVMDRIGSLQFDPLEVPGARNHDLVLHARIDGYRREWADHWLYGPLGERRLVELYNKMLSIVPMDELPYYRLSWTRGAVNYAEFLTEHAGLADRIRTHIRDEGPVSTAAFRDVDHRIQWWWDNDETTSTKAARAVMEAMFVAGELGISRREGSRRYYDLTDRLVPADLLARHAPEPEQLRHRLISRHRGVGLMAESGAAELVWGTGTAPERKKMTAELIDDGTLIPVRVEGLKETRHVLADERPLLEATAQPDPDRTPSMAFLAPLGPMMWDRRLIRDLFGFAYIWEVYVPQPKRRHGYYVLPILFGDRFVGRIEPRYERATRTLRIPGIWFEEGFRPMEEPHFVPALTEAVHAYRSFVGAEKITWPRTRLGRELAKATR